ncbi:MAG: SUMF1/EgtB/PvdO family nonheme iron enzyme [Proteobacteria bacterium]|nr:SUMF1/EgtB/PvdO family nonheme iron enzyme [Pseudomonadota bacterium]
MKRIEFRVIGLSAFCVLALGAMAHEVQANPIDCKDAGTLSECTSVCDDYVPPEIDFTPPFSKYLKRYNDCLKKAYKTFRYPKYWFSDYSQKDRYRSMFLKNLFEPAVSKGRMSSCEGKNLPMPVLIEEWEGGMMTRVVGISNNKWIKFNIPGISEKEGVTMGTISGNQTKYYESVNVDSYIYTQPMNIGEEPELKTYTVESGESFEFSYDDALHFEDFYPSHLPVPSDKINAVNEFGLVVWSGFEMSFIEPNGITINPGKQKIELESTARYEYNDVGLPVRVTTSHFETDSQSFREKSEVCTEFDESGHLAAMDDCSEEKKSSMSLVYEEGNHCPVQITDNKGNILYRFEYNKEHRLTRIYQLGESPNKVKREIRLYYSNDADYNWPIRNLKYRYSKSLKSEPDKIKPAPDGMKMFNPNERFYIEKHFARPFYMDLKPVTQQEFKERMGRNPSYFGTDVINKSSTDTFSIATSEENDSRNRPVENVTWYDALAFANARSKAEGFEECYKLEKCEIKDDRYICRNATFKGLDCKGYRLPTSDESRVLNTDRVDYSYRPSADNCIDLDWGWKQGCFSTYPIDTAKRDEDGLYDHHGNIYEWQWDWYGPSEGYCWGVFCDDIDEEPANQHNTLGPTTGWCRALAGSSFDREGEYRCYPPDRGGSQIGFRLVRTAELGE